MAMSTRALWVIHHVNPQEFIGRFDGRWTHTRDIDAAALWHSRAEAENALQALLQEAGDRIKEKHGVRTDWWFSLYGGLVEILEVEQITQVRAQTPA